MLPSFQDRIYPVNRPIADRWAVLSAQMQRKGKRIAAIDGLIAATALENGLTVVTRDLGDFDGACAPILNPWDMQSPVAVPPDPQ